MSGSRDEAWERRKAYLIRCLFNDVPYRVLSPIREESTRSFTASPRDGASNSSSMPPPLDTTYPLVSCNFNKREQRSVVPSVNVDIALDERAHSPLPPLIIERAPNKHDDPPEYYGALLAKIRNIYRKMFIENVDLSEDDLLYSDHEQHSILSNVVLTREESCSSDVNVSNGYSGDLDSSQDSTNSKSIELYRNVNDTEQKLENGRKLFAMFETESTFMLGGDEYNISYCDLNDQVMADTSSLKDEEPHYRQITTQAHVHTDGSPQTDVRPSPVYDYTASQTARSASVNKQLPHRDAHTCVRDDTEHSQPSQKPTFNVHYETQNPNSDEHIEDAQVSDLIQHLPIQDSACQNMEEDLRVTSRRYMFEEPVRELLVRENGDQEEPVEVSVVEPAEYEIFEDQATSDTQITRPPHSLEQSSPPAPEAEVTQRAALVLRYRRTGDGTLVGENEIAGQDQQTMPATSSSTSEHELEVMRPHRTEPARLSLVLDVPRKSTDMELTCEHNTIPRDISSVTSPSQDGCLEYAAEMNSSRSIDNILSSIFNESSNKNEEPSNKAVTSRKRSYKDISMQTEKYVKWNDLCANLFVGRAKIYKLCSCAGHSCA